jgi:Divergent InlB B-repeat domain/Cellulase (glycosyl hydrolase family 5)
MRSRRARAGSDPNNARSRRTRVLALTAVLLITGVAAVGVNTSPSTTAAAGCETGSDPTPSTPTPCDLGFVSRTGTHLSLYGNPYQFTGFNIYNANNQGSCWYALNNGTALAESLDGIAAGGVIRAWFFQPFVTINGFRDFSAFDKTLQLAAERGIKVIPVLANQWADCDGPDGGGGEKKLDTWFTDGYKTEVHPGGTVPYRTYVEEIVSRYAYDPTVLAWQLMNEAEIIHRDSNGVEGCPDGASTVLRDFAADVSGRIKAIDANHLVSLGTLGSGQCGAAGDEYSFVHDVGTIDLCEYHDYGSPASPLPGDQYNGLLKRIEQCNALDKPVFIGEAGISPDQVGGSLQDRANAFASKRDAQFAAGVVGMLAWAWDSDWSTLNDFDISPRDPLLPTFGNAAAPSSVFTLRVTKSGSGDGSVTRRTGGPGCAKDCVAELDAGASVTVVAYPQDGSHFVGWSGTDVASCGFNYCTMTMDSARAVTATFAIDAPVTARIVVSPATAVVGTGTAQAFTVEGFDADDQSLGDQTGAATFTISPSGSCAANTCSAPTVGVRVVTATVGTLTATASLDVRKSQTVKFTAPAAKKMTQSPVAVSATSTSGLAVVFSTTSSGVCATSGTNGSSIVLLGPGTCTVSADQGGNATWAPAPTVVRSFAVSKATQSITFPAQTAKTIDASPVTVAATSSSGLAVTFTTTTPAVCTSTGTNGTSIVLLDAGTCTVRADQVGNNVYAAAASVSRNFTVSKLANAITFATIAKKTLAESPVTATATSSSGLAVTFSTTTPTVCTAGGANGATITLVTAGTCTVRADQSGNATYKAANAVNRSFAVTKVAQTITFAALTNKGRAQSPVTVAATASSGLVVQFTTTTPTICTAGGTNGSVITLVAAGTCTVRADQTGDGFWAAAPAVNRSFKVT